MTIPATQKLFNCLITDLASNSRDKAKFREEMKTLIHDVAVENATAGKQAAAQVVADYWAAYVTAYVKGYTDEATLKANKKHDIDNPVLTVKEYLKAETGYTFKSNRPKFAAVLDGSDSYQMTVEKVEENAADTSGTSAAAAGAGKDSGEADAIVKTNFATIEEFLNAGICQGFSILAITQQCLCRVGLTVEQANTVMQKITGEAADNKGKTTRGKAK